MESRDDVIAELYSEIEGICEDFALARRIREPVRRARFLVVCDKALDAVLDKARAYRDPEIESLVERMIEELR